MKRVFTLLIATGLLVAADAQPGVRNGRSPVGVNVSVNNRSVASNSFAADRRMREEIIRINIKYDRKIQQVRSSLFTRPAVKARKIHSLEGQRQREIRNVQLKYNRYNYGNRRY